jgi:HEAT repeat protein
MDARVRIEAVEALGTLHSPQALDALVRIIWRHGSPDVQREAVETLGDYQDVGVVAHLEKILVEHADAQAVAEALDVLGELKDPRAQRRIAAVARTSRNAHVRREALQLLGEAQEQQDERAGGLTAEQFATLLERAIFEDSDHSVQLEALEVAAESLPRALARRLLRRVADEHPVRSIREEAFEQLQDIGGT